MDTIQSVGGIFRRGLSRKTSFLLFLTCLGCALSGVIDAKDVRPVDVDTTDLNDLPVPTAAVGYYTTKKGNWAWEYNAELVGRSTERRKRTEWLYKLRNKKPKNERARIFVTVPHRARVIVFGWETPISFVPVYRLNKATSFATFDTPKLEGNLRYGYDFWVEVTRDGKTYYEKKEAVFRAGDLVRIEFNPRKRVFRSSFDEDHEEASIHLAEDSNGKLRYYKLVKTEILRGGRKEIKREVKWFATDYFYDFYQMPVHQNPPSYVKEYLVDEILKRDPRVADSVDLPGGCRNYLAQYDRKSRSTVIISPTKHKYRFKGSIQSIACTSDSVAIIGKGLDTSGLKGIKPKSSSKYGLYIFQYGQLVQHDTLSGLESWKQVERVTDLNSASNYYRVWSSAGRIFAYDSKGERTEKRLPLDKSCESYQLMSPAKDGYYSLNYKKGEAPTKMIARVGTILSYACDGVGNFALVSHGVRVTSKTRPAKPKYSNTDFKKLSTNRSQSILVFHQGVPVIANEDSWQEVAFVKENRHFRALTSSKKAMDFSVDGEIIEHALALGQNCQQFEFERVDRDNETRIYFKNKGTRKKLATVTGLDRYACRNSAIVFQSDTLTLTDKKKYKEKGYYLFHEDKLVKSETAALDYVAFVDSPWGEVFRMKSGGKVFDLTASGAAPKKWVPIDCQGYAVRSDDRRDTYSLFRVLADGKKLPLGLGKYFENVSCVSKKSIGFTATYFSADDKNLKNLKGSKTWVGPRYFQIEENRLVVAKSGQYRMLKKLNPSGKNAYRIWDEAGKPLDLSEDGQFFRTEVPLSQIDPSCEAFRFFRWNEFGDIGVYLKKDYSLVTIAKSIHQVVCKGERLFMISQAVYGEGEKRPQTLGHFIVGIFKKQVILSKPARSGTYEQLGFVETKEKETFVRAVGLVSKKGQEKKIRLNEEFHLNGQTREKFLESENCAYQFQQVSKDTFSIQYTDAKKTSRVGLLRGLRTKVCVQKVLVLAGEELLTEGEKKPEQPFNSNALHVFSAGVYQHELKPHGKAKFINLLREKNSTRAWIDLGKGKLTYLLPFDGSELEIAPYVAYDPKKDPIIQWKKRIEYEATLKMVARRGQKFSIQEKPPVEELNPLSALAPKLDNKIKQLRYDNLLQAKVSGKLFSDEIAKRMGRKKETFKLTFPNFLRIATPNYGKLKFLFDLADVPRLEDFDKEKIYAGHCYFRDNPKKAFPGRLHLFRLSGTNKKPVLLRAGKDDKNNPNYFLKVGNAHRRHRTLRESLNEHTPFSATLPKEGKDFLPQALMSTYTSPKGYREGYLFRRIRSENREIYITMSVNPRSSQERYQSGMVRGWEDFRRCIFFKEL